MSGMVIVGAGLAGVSAAEALRACGYEGPVQLFDDENEWPYDRPPLSKSYLGGDLPDERCHLRPAEWYRDNRIILLRGQAITAIEAATHCVVAADGTRHSYDKLLLATGARARTLPGLEGPHPRLVGLRSIADARALRAMLRQGARAILVGGGVIGMECAATAVRAGCTVTVLEAGSRIMARFFPPAMSDFLAAKHAREGVVIRTGFIVQRVELGDDGVAVLGQDGTRMEGDFVIAGVGALPNVALAEAAGLRLAAGGIAVDVCGQSSVPDIYAAGDCAAFVGADGTPTRWENWTHATAHAQDVARVMAGGAGCYAAIPWVWSDQYELNIQVTGRADAEGVVLRGDMASARFTLFHLVGGRVVGATTVNNGRDKRPLRALVAAGSVVAAETLADISVKLQTLAPSGAG